MRKTELAWAAGFFDGEGTIRAGRGVRRSDPQRKTFHNIVLNITQKDKRVLLRFKRAVGLGKIYGPYRNKRTKTGYWRFSIGKYASVERIVRLLWPWLDVLKRRQAHNALKGWTNEPRLKVGRKPR